MKKILVIDDDQILVKALSVKLKEEGFAVSLAADGEEGLAVAEKEKPDLVLCDINMPRLDGLSMLAKLRATDWGADLPVIMLTNYSDKEKVSTALNHWVFGYLVKSDWDLSQIVGEIKKRLPGA